MDPRDPRQSQAPPPNLPFSRNTQSPLYTRQGLPPPNHSSASSTPAQTAYAAPQQQQQQQQPHSQHPPASGSSTYSSDHHPRRTSDPHYYPSSRPYEPSGPLAPSNHSRHQSSSSMSHAPSMSRPMPHPGSPSQSSQGSGPGPMGGSASYGLPPPRAPPVSVGPPSAFPNGRELPSLNSIARTASGGSSMSISSMLGGPSQSREPPASSFAPPPTSTAGPGPSYPSSTHASPRMGPSPSEYAPYRRPHTPEQHQRMYDGRDARNAAGSPRGMHLTPEMQRYGTPQTFRPPPPPMAPVEHSREFQRGPAGSVPPPPRPNSQPKAYPPHSRPIDMGRPAHPDMYPRREEVGPGGEYNPERPIMLKHEEPRHLSEREKFERERFERERYERDRFERERFEREREMELRERDRRERTMSGGEAGRTQPMHPPEHGQAPGMSRREPPPPQYARGPDPREQPQWQRPPYDQSRPPYEESRPPPRQPEYPRTSVPPYSQPAGPYSQSPLERYPPSSHPGQQQQQQQQQPPMPHTSHPGPALGSPDRHRAAAPLPPQHQQPHRRPGEDGPPLPSVAYSSGHTAMFESPRARPVEESAHPMAPQQNFLRVQEMNRKGRISPLPQAVQGAQPQIQGPPGEAGIKSEFGRMFSGIGSGLSGLGVPSPVATGAQLPFPGSGTGRRDDLDHAPQEPTSDPKAGRDNTARNKRRKAKEEDVKGDEESNGRATPSGRAKRPKTHSHHHHHQ